MPRLQAKESQDVLVITLETGSLHHHPWYLDFISYLFLNLFLLFICHEDNMVEGIPSE